MFFLNRSNGLNAFGVIENDLILKKNSLKKKTLQFMLIEKN
jgi:hypothetical protein